MVFRAPTIDPAITLFGTRISVLETQPDEDDHLPAKPACSDDVPTCAETKVCQEKADPALVPGLDHHDELIREGPTSTIVDDVAVLVPNDNEGDKNRECSSNDNSTTCPDPDTSSQQKVLKKPDKILPCPRCNSLETKFCYYNNYNVNQPRYYCKKCERYWTDGGTMRNVPVGAGRRKNKHSANHCRNPCASSEGMPHPGINVSVPLPGHMQPSCNPQHESGNMMVLKFRPKEPHHQIEEDPLNVGERSKVIQSCSTTSESQGNSSAPVTVTDHTTRNRPPDDIPEVVQNAGTAYAKVASVHPMQYYPGNNWTFLRSPGWNSAAFAAVGCASDTICGPENGGPNVLPWSPTSFVSAPAYVSPTIPLPLVPAAFWGCMTSWPTGAWNAPLVGYHGSLSPSAPLSLASQPTNECSGNQSFKLGKRLRDGASQVEDKAAASLWFPKTLRIDDPDQAAKSSIWATLGIKHDPSKPITKGTLFKCFQTETKGKIQQSDANEVLDANPAALSRSLAFQEGS